MTMLSRLKNYLGKYREKACTKKIALDDIRLSHQVLERLFPNYAQYSQSHPSQYCVFEQYRNSDDITLTQEQLEKIQVLEYMLLISKA
ncbi:MAG: hypothetical protein CMI01_19325 [Oceanospirillaceae bacterium]|nr:hypothetical protein [Oceanospirillaceae bacterium]